MKRSRFFAFLSRLITGAVVGVLLFQVGCGNLTPGGVAPVIPSSTAPTDSGGGSATPTIGTGSTPASPPAPPSEIPLLALADVAISVDTLRSSDPTPPGGSALRVSPSVSALVSGQSGPYANAISASPNIVFLTQKFFQGAVSILKPVVIPVGTGVTSLPEQIAPNTFIFMDFPGVDANGREVIDLNQSVSLKGQTCSGNTTLSPGHPLCMRLWVGSDSGSGTITYAPYLEAFFTTYPQIGNPGAGEVRFLEPNFIGTGMQDNVTVVYDLQDPAKKHIEEFWAVYQPSTEPSDASIVTSFHATVSQDGLDNAQPIKTTNGIAEDGGTPAFGFGQWREGTDLWLGTQHDPSDSSPQGNFDNLCIVISTADLADPQGQCGAAGLDISSQAELSVAVFDDLRLFNFPAVPF